jgi:hypothetical protein
LFLCNILANQIFKAGKTAKISGPIILKERKTTTIRFSLIYRGKYRKDKISTPPIL